MINNTDSLSEAPKEGSLVKCQDFAKQHPLFLLSHSVQQSEMDDDWEIAEGKKKKPQNSKAKQFSV